MQGRSRDCRLAPRPLGLPHLWPLSGQAPAKQGPLGSLERPPGLSRGSAQLRFVGTEHPRCCSEPPAPPSGQPRTLHVSSLDDTHTPEGLPLVCGVPLQGAAACPQEPSVTQTTPRVPTRSRVHLPKLLAGPRLTGSESTVKPGGRGQAGARRQLPGAPRCPSRPCCAPSATSTIRSSELGSLKGSWSPGVCSWRSQGRAVPRLAAGGGLRSQPAGRTASGRTCAARH